MLLKLLHFPFGHREPLRNIFSVAKLNNSTTRSSLSGIINFQSCDLNILMKVKPEELQTTNYKLQTTNYNYATH